MNMTTKNYEKDCARLVQDALKTMSYQDALNQVRRHQTEHPEKMTKEARALVIVETILKWTEPIPKTNSGVSNGQ